MWQITGAVGIFGLTGLISSLISNTIVTTAVMGNSVSNILTSWFSNFLECLSIFLVMRD